MFSFVLQRHERKSPHAQCLHARFAFCVYDVAAKSPRDEITFHFIWTCLYCDDSFLLVVFFICIFRFFLGYQNFYIVTLLLRFFCYEYRFAQTQIYFSLRVVFSSSCLGCIKQDFILQSRGSLPFPRIDYFQNLAGWTSCSYICNILMKKKTKL